MIVTAMGFKHETVNSLSAVHKLTIQLFLEYENPSKSNALKRICFLQGVQDCEARTCCIGRGQSCETLGRKH